MKVVKPVICTLLTVFAGIIPGMVSGQIVINEACSYNGNILEDEDGDNSDWIELYNAGNTAVNLDKYALKGNQSASWELPAIMIQAQEYLIVFASGKDRTFPNLHSNFKLSKEGETIRLFDPSRSEVDLLSLPLLHLDHSYGHKPDGYSGNVGIFDMPSPGSSNQNSSQYFGYANQPVFSIQAGVYSGAISLEMIANNANIYYTLDGSIPDLNSTQYTTPITINNTKIVRARAYSYQSTELPSELFSNTYILNFDSKLPIFSISTDPANLYDWNSGILVSGPNASPDYPYYGANYWQDWEVAAEIEFFETNGQRKISQTAGISIHGGSSNRTRPMKSLRLSAKNKFGENKFKHTFFDDKSIAEFKNLVLRNSSGDFNKTHFRDGSLHDLMIGKTDIDLMAYRPSAVFLNGNYYGILNIREKISKHYIEENYRINGDDLDLLEEDSLVIEGDFKAFNTMHSFITGNDMNIPGNFSLASSMIDTHSLCDYYIAETYLSNIDWPYNNLKFWRLRQPGSKFRYILIDLDISLGNNGWAPADYDVLGKIMGPYGDNNRHVQIFKKLLNNRGFREYFINRYADLVNTLFSAENVTNHISETRKNLANEMPMHFNIWGNTMQGWEKEINNIVMPYIQDRPSYSMQQVRDVFGLQDIVSVELDVWPPNAGTIRINSIAPSKIPWKGDYFNGNPIDITIVPNPGFTFTKWDSDHIILNDPRSLVLHINPAKSNRFTAFFSNSTELSQLMLYPNPVKDNLQFGCILEEASSARIEIINMQGQKILMKNDLELQRGINKLDLNLDHIGSGIYLLHLITSEGLKTGRFIKI